MPFKHVWLPCEAYPKKKKKKKRSLSFIVTQLLSQCLHKDVFGSKVIDMRSFLLVVQEGFFFFQLHCYVFSLFFHDLCQAELLIKTIYRVLVSLKKCSGKQQKHFLEDGECEQLLLVPCSQSLIYCYSMNPRYVACIISAFDNINFMPFCLFIYLKYSL